MSLERGQDTGMSLGMRTGHGDGLGEGDRTRGWPWREGTGHRDGLGEEDRTQGCSWRGKDSVEKPFGFWKLAKSRWRCAGCFLTGVP